MPTPSLQQPARCVSLCPRGAIAADAPTSTTLGPKGYLLRVNKPSHQQHSIRWHHALQRLHMETPRWPTMASAHPILHFGVSIGSQRPIPLDKSALETHLKRLLFALSAALLATSMTVMPPEAHAKRLGGGKAAGMQRQNSSDQTHSNPTPTTPTGQPAGPTGTPGGQPAVSNAVAPGAAAAGTAAATTGKRSWMGPVAGLAAGLGLAALASHFGFGEELANFMMMALLAVVALLAIRWVMKRMSTGKASMAGGSQGMQFAGAMAGAQNAPAGQNQPPQSTPTASAQTLGPFAERSSPGGTQWSTPGSPPPSNTLPDGADTADIERLAKLMFIRMQTANDAANLDDLRKFTTPELFASLQLDLHERGSAPQQTDVMQLQAQLVDTEQTPSQWVVSVRFQGLIREVADGTATPFDEIWHLVRSTTGSADWAVAGLTPRS